MKLKDMTDEELLTALANAEVTAARSLGHFKAARNDEAAELYSQELKRRGVKIPATDELYELGQFNGEGSW
ncbi:MAG: hypothetical protein NXI32_04895 [bacterium]|nr:hypothetical protein [bacterium]